MNKLALISHWLADNNFFFSEFYDIIEKSEI